MLVEDAVKIKNSDIAQHLKLPPVKLHCSMLAEDAIQAAVNDFKLKQAERASKGADAAEKAWSLNYFKNV